MVCSSMKVYSKMVEIEFVVGSRFSTMIINAIFSSSGADKRYRVLSRQEVLRRIHGPTKDQVISKRVWSKR